VLAYVRPSGSRLCDRRRCDRLLPGGVQQLSTCCRGCRPQASVRGVRDRAARPRKKTLAEVHSFLGIPTLVVHVLTHAWFSHPPAGRRVARVHSGVTLRGHLTLHRDRSDVLPKLTPRRSP
jgi:hypothetical protein